MSKSAPNPKQYRIQKLPENKWHTCPICHGTGKVEMTGDLHRSAGIIPCTNHNCHGGIVKTETVEFTPLEKEQRSNATFYIFKESGKYYADGRGFLPEKAFEPMLNHYERRGPILEANEGKMPGLNSIGDGFIIMIVPDANVEYGWPLMLPVKNDFLPHM